MNGLMDGWMIGFKIDEISFPASIQSSKHPITHF